MANGLVGHGARVLLMTGIIICMQKKDPFMTAKQVEEALMDSCKI